jgi:hypothetical protein
MDGRTDPVEILARVSERDGRPRAFEVWVHKVRQAGWSVTIESTSFDEPGTGCGIVEIEGLRYRVHHGHRVRQRLAILPGGMHPAIAAKGEPVAAEWGWTFAYAAWAEPILDA